MSVLWFIIKIILFILLGIVLLLLSLLVLVLLAPIRYEAYFAKYDELGYDVKFRYLAGIKGRFFLQDNKKRHRISVFGKNLYEDISEAVETAVTKTEQDAATPEEETEANQEAERKTAIDFGDVKEETQTLKKEFKEGFLSEPAEEKKQAKREKVKSPEPGKKADSAKKTPASQTGRNIRENLTNPLTYRTIKEVIKAIWDLLKIILPYEWDFELVVGTGEPADTGELVAKLTMLYPLYYQHGIVRGDYENECLMGGFLARGRFNLLQIIVRVIKLYFQKDVNAYIHLIKSKGR